MPPQKLSLREGLFRRIVIDDTGAWWAGALTSSGYPSFRGKRAHRLIYEMFVGPIPSEMDIDHQCHNEDESCRGGSTCIHRRCMLTAHMVPRTRGDNVRLGRGPQLAKERKAALTHCQFGHPLELLPGKAGKRGCRVCRRKRGRERGREEYRRKVGIPLDAPLIKGRPTARRENQDSTPPQQETQ